jgi:hypothetical protein
MDKYYEACANNGNDYFICDDYDCISFWYLLLACVFWQALVQTNKNWIWMIKAHAAQQPCAFYIY